MVGQEGSSVGGWEKKQIHDARVQGSAVLLCHQFKVQHRDVQYITVLDRASAESGQPVCRMPHVFEGVKFPSKKWRHGHVV